MHEKIRRPIPQELPAGLSSDATIVTQDGTRLTGGLSQSEIARRLGEAIQSGELTSTGRRPRDPEMQSLKRK